MLGTAVRVYIAYDRAADGLGAAGLSGADSALYATFIESGDTGKVDFARCPTQAAAHTNPVRRLKTAVGTAAQPSRNSLERERMRLREYAPRNKKRWGKHETDAGNTNLHSILQFQDNEKNNGSVAIR